jgi:hypothetical protein
MKTLVLALSVGIVTAQAGVIHPKAQTRTIQAYLDIAGTPNVQQSSASGFNTFSNSVGFMGGGRYEPYYVQATQSSKIGPASVTAEGLASVGLGNGLVGNGGAGSDFTFKFRLLEPVAATLTGQLVWNEIQTMVAESPVVKLSGAQGVIFQTDAAEWDGTPLDYATNVSLSPGEYTLEAHASVTNDFCCGADRSFTLNFTATSSGPTNSGSGIVYEVTGALEGRTVTDNRIRSVWLRSKDLAKMALDEPAGNTSGDHMLAFVSDRLDHSLRLAIWDKQTAAIIAELGSVEAESSLEARENFAAVANWRPSPLGRIVQPADAAPGHLTMATKGTIDAGGSVNHLHATSTIGQFYVADRSGGTTNTVLIRGGALLLTGRRLGTVP